MKLRVMPILIGFLLIGACADENLFHTLTVVNGSGSGTYQTGSTIAIEADPPSNQFEQFQLWKGDTTFLVDPFAASTEVDMPLQDLLIEATYAALPKFVLTVVNGSGSGQYFEGEAVTLLANDPLSPEQVFSFWSGDSMYLDEPLSPTASLKMPAKAIQLEATYVDLPKYALTVVNGSGSGEYLEGARIFIQGIPPNGNDAFLEWAGGVAHLERTDTIATWVTMPASAISVEALFEMQQTLISFSNQIQPLFKLRCVDGGCHDRWHPRYTFETYSDIRNNLNDIIASTRVGGGMDYFTEQELDLFRQWIDEGALNN